MKSTLHKVFVSPELNLGVFSFLVHFAWEILQMPLFGGVQEARYLDVLFMCLLATFGDVAIVLTAFWVVAWRTPAGRRWLGFPTVPQVAGFTLVGVLITLLIEIVATKVWERWSYGELMPVIPFLDVGLSPLLQWALLSPLIVWFVHRQVR